VPGCTKCDAEHFFSHRRDGDSAGRHIGVIVAR
jgi:copper oxidase (laccase) domain-containing protein